MDPYFDDFLTDSSTSDSEQIEGIIGIPPFFNNMYITEVAKKFKPLTFQNIYDLHNPIELMKFNMRNDYTKSTIPRNSSQPISTAIPRKSTTIQSISTPIPRTSTQPKDIKKPTISTIPKIPRKSTKIQSISTPIPRTTTQPKDIKKPTISTIPKIPRKSTKIQSISTPIPRTTTQSKDIKTKTLLIPDYPYKVNISPLINAFNTILRNAINNNNDNFEYLLDNLSNIERLISEILGKDGIRNQITATPDIEIEISEPVIRISSQSEKQAFDRLIQQLVQAMIEVIKNIPQQTGIDVIIGNLQQILRILETDFFD